MAERIIKEEEMASILKDYAKASSSEDKKKEIGKIQFFIFLAKLAEKVETGMTLIGCSAVEDKLQEEVPETIRDMLKASTYLPI